MIINKGEAALLMVNKIAAKTSSGELKSLKIARGFTDDSSVVEVEKRNQDLIRKKPNDPPASEEERILAGTSRNLSNSLVSDNAADQPQAQDYSLPFLEISNVPDTFSAQSDDELEEERSASAIAANQDYGYDNKASRREGSNADGGIAIPENDGRTIRV
ncbi:hypothetical protein M0R45_001618 [Rubus argutus]|uniref:Uncharacterized protein n=1 Tax=Rubus argutus TaxID=59490 RepID=A0AAW1VJY3_RUBAR